MGRDRSPRGEATEADLVAQVVDYAIFTLDVDGFVRSWNAGAERLKGYPASEILGRSFREFYAPDDQAAGLPESLLEQARRDGRVEHEGWRVRRDGSRFWGDVVITALRDEDGELTGFGKVTRDLTEQHRLAEDLRRSEERFRVLVSQVTDYAIIALEPDGTIDSWNAGAERVKGWTAEEAIGLHFSVFYPEQDREAGLPEQLLQRALVDGRVEHEGWRVRKDGSQFWGDVVITVLHDDSGAVRGFAKVTRDLTARKQLEDAQDSFYAAFEHDFRSPVAAIKGFSELLEGGDVELEKRRALVSRIRTNADRLLVMTGELVEYARLRSGRTSLDVRGLDLVEVAAETVAGLGLGAGGAGGRGSSGWAGSGAISWPGEGSGSNGDVRVQLAGGCAQIEADRVSVERIIVNLVTNALRYSPDDSVVEVRCDPGPPGFSRLTVRDQGRGIASEDLPRIFDEFERGALASEDGGTGLGLASVKKLVEVNGGRIGLDSEVGRGTTVSVDFPLRT